jgi:hypothetical protein
MDQARRPGSWHSRRPSVKARASAKWATASEWVTWVDGAVTATSFVAPILSNAGVPDGLDALDTARVLRAGIRLLDALRSRDRRTMTAGDARVRITPDVGCCCVHREPFGATATRPDNQRHKWYAVGGVSVRQRLDRYSCLELARGSK